ncbi:hypothetical protein MMYC01_208411 [Madurella mycetomatis]|uniref:Uncharacterized protein n=1 Tax=Madurella mycetomatis TaxID=100816 RepID=A0A175VSJ6_9PEZI|nr:hypothetical protein MMYC01_208411 [Madurella mycetomatis]
MTEPDTDRPGSSAAGHYASPIPPSPRPSVTSRASRSSLRREQERQEAQAQPRPASVAYSHPQAAQPIAAAPFEEPPRTPSSTSPLQPPQLPAFSPLFTLLTSTSHASNRQTIHHPTVHYIFADDDPEILTAALAHHHSGAYEDPSGEDDGRGSGSGVHDRAVLLDMESAPDGSSLEVAWASSLSPDWAVTSARVSRMEAGGDGAVVAGPNGGLVLKIEGVSLEPSSGAPMGKAGTPEAELQSSGGSTGRQQQQQPPPAAEEYGDLLQDFEKRMAILRKVVEAGAARQRASGTGRDQVSEGLPFRPGVEGDDAQHQAGARQ